MKNHNKIKKTLKKLLLISLLFLLIPGFAFGASIDKTAPRIKAKKAQTTGVQQRTLGRVTPGDLKPIIKKAEILNLTIGTEASGIWFWEATIKNTGNVELDWQHVVVQGYKKSFPQSQNPWTAASGSLIGPGGNLLPNQTRIIKEYWTRCCKTDVLKVDLRDNASNTIFDTETLTNLLHSPTLKRALDVRIKRIDWNDTTKTWQATLKNFSNYTIKLSVQGYLWRANTSIAVPAGGALVTLGPNGEASAMWLNAPQNTQHGDMLKVHTKFLMGSNFCSESNNDCGFKGSNNIIIPNSHSFLN